MGIKGSKHSEEVALAAELFLEKLGSIDGVTSKKMFGGHGIFHEGKMFGIVDSKGNYFLKADEALKPEFLEMGSEQHSRMPYYSIPNAILTSHDELISLAHKSIATIKK